jgi:hypothetical protein
MQIQVVFLNSHKERSSEWVGTNSQAKVQGEIIFHYKKKYS